MKVSLTVTVFFRLHMWFTTCITISFFPTSHTVPLLFQHMSCHGWVKTPELNIEFTYAMYSFFFLKLDLSTGRLILWTLFQGKQPLVKVTQPLIKTYSALMYSWLVVDGKRRSDFHYTSLSCLCFCAIFILLSSSLISVARVFSSRILSPIKCLS